MTHELAQIQEIDTLHIDPHLLDHHQFPGGYLKPFVLNIVTVICNSIRIEILHV